MQCEDNSVTKNNKVHDFIEVFACFTQQINLRNEYQNKINGKGIKGNQCWLTLLSDHSHMEMKGQVELTDLLYKAHFSK